MKKILVEVVKGVSGFALYIGTKDSGYRLAGPKPWGGGKTVHSFEVDTDELRKELDTLSKDSP